MMDTARERLGVLIARNGQLTDLLVSLLPADEFAETDDLDLESMELIALEIESNIENMQGLVQTAAQIGEAERLQVEIASVRSALAASIRTKDDETG